MPFVLHEHYTTVWLTTNFQTFEKCDHFCHSWTLYELYMSFISYIMRGCPIIPNTDSDVYIRIYIVCLFYYICLLPYMPFIIYAFYHVCLFPHMPFPMASGLCTNRELPMSALAVCYIFSVIEVPQVLDMEGLTTTIFLWLISSNKSCKNIINKSKNEKLLCNLN